MRVFLLNVALFALPFLLYMAWIKLVKNQTIPVGKEWNDAPLMWLVSAGAVLFFVGLLMTRYLSVGDIEGGYVPPHVIDGQIVPGTQE